jgi:MFS family permease
MSGSLRAQTGWRYYGWWGIVLATFIIIWTTNGLTIGGFTVFDPYLLQELQIERAPLKLADSILLGTAAIFTLLTGWAADRYGVRPVMTFGIVVISASLFGHAYVDTLSELYWLRFLMGLGLAGAGLAICVVTVSRWFEARRGLALALMLAGTSLGTAIFPSLFTICIERLGWRSAIIYVSLTPLLLLPIVWFAIKEWPTRIGLVPYGADATQSIASGPELTYRDIISRRKFWLIGISAFAIYYSILGVTNNLILHGRDLGFTPGEAAALFFPMFIMGVVGKILSGTLSDVFGRKLVWVLNLALMLGGALLLMTLSKSLVVVAVTMFGFGWGGTHSLLQAIAADAFGTRSLGRVMGALTVLDAGGGGLGPWVTSLLYDRTGSYAAGFGVIVVLIVVAIVLALTLRLRAPAVGVAAAVPAP